MVDAIILGAAMVAPIRDIYQDIFHGSGVSGARHNMVEGNPENGDECLFKRKIRTGYVPFSYAKDTIVFPQKGSNTEGKTITAVAAYDAWGDDTGGTAKIVKGGVGCKYVEVIHNGLEDDLWPLGHSYCHDLWPLGHPQRPRGKVPLGGGLSVPAKIRITTISPEDPDSDSNKRNKSTADC